MSREEIQNILIRLTDVTGYAFQDSQAAAAFQTAINEIKRLLAQEREKVREKCIAGIEQMEGHYDTWQEAIVCIRQLDLTKDLAASSREEHEHRR